MEQIVSIIKEELEHIDNRISDLKFKDNIIYNKLNDFLLSPSKRIRSIITILYLRAHEIKITDKIVDILCTTELIHNASLLHDDVIDDALIRRNQTTIAKQFSPKISILTGDCLISCAMDILLNLNNTDFLNKFKKCITAMCEAEIQQYLLRNKVPDIKTYIQICEGKTSELFKTALFCSAQTSGINTDRAESFGKLFGILYQIKNDTEQSSYENDIKNGVNTAVNIIGIEKTKILADNYINKLRRDLSTLPDNKYREAIGELLKYYD